MAWHTLVRNRFDTTNLTSRTIYTKPPLFSSLYKRDPLDNLFLCACNSVLFLNMWQRFSLTNAIKSTMPTRSRRAIFVSEKSADGDGEDESEDESSDEGLPLLLLRSSFFLPKSCTLRGSWISPQRCRACPRPQRQLPFEWRVLSRTINQPIRGRRVFVI